MAAALLRSWMELAIQLHDNTGKNIGCPITTSVLSLIRMLAVIGQVMQSSVLSCIWCWPAAANFWARLQRRQVAYARPLACACVQLDAWQQGA